MTVLCVENVPDALVTLESMLAGIGYEVVGVTNAGQALEVLTTNQVDGVLLEYDLLDANGAAVKAKMNQMKPEVPVLLFVGVGAQTPSLVRFLDSYLRRESRREEAWEGPEA